jgi:hypothetical protein
MEYQGSLLQFRTTPKGYYYGGEEHFREEVIKLTLESHATAALSPEAQDLDELSPLLPIALHLLLDDNTGLVASQYPTSPAHKYAIADAIRAFMSEQEATLKKSTLHKDRKVVALCLTMEMWYSRFNTAGLSEEEIKKKVANRMQDVEMEKISALVFNFQFPDKQRDNIQIYRITGPGQTELFDDLKIKEMVQQEDIWADMLTRKAVNASKHAVLTPKDAEAYVSKVIKSLITTTTYTEPMTDEEKAKLTAVADSIDISDLFRPSPNPNSGE